MIFVDRSLVSRPAIFQEYEIDAYQKRLEKHFLSLPTGTSEEHDLKFKVDWKSVSGNDLRLSLVEVFHSKCPFCESLVFDRNLMFGEKEDTFQFRKRKILESLDEIKNDPIMGDYYQYFASSELPEHSTSGLTQFRPRSWAKDLFGRSSYEHYWWLDYQWENLYLTCKPCKNRKMNRFPVKGNRISRGQSTDEEDALLIDPCRKRDFEVEDISFKGPEAIPMTEYGETTIQTLELNRERLIENRRMVLSRAQKKVEGWLEGSSQLLPSGNLFSNAQPYIGTIISNARLNLSMRDFDKLMEVMPFQNQIREYSNILRKNKKTYSKSRLKKTAETFYTKQRAYSLDKLVKEKRASRSQNRKAYFRSSKWIERIEIKNFKNIKSLDLKFPSASDIVSNDVIRPWLVLLGENGIGKSTVLQAVAMTLMGQKRLDKYKFDAGEYVTRGRPRKSTIKVYLTNRRSNDPIVLTILKDNKDPKVKTFDLNVKEPQVALMGYGATRLLTKDEKKPFTNDFIRTKNLFDHFEQLDNVQKWLRDPEQVDDSLFNAISESLSDLLMLKGENRFRRSSRAQNLTFITDDGEEIPLNFLSSGYKAVIALALDIMIGVSQIYGEGEKSSRLQDAEGIVLIDEIGVHLHPRWKMWIVGALRRTFPKMNFLVTTHEPLCLRGLEKGEVFVVKPNEEKGIEIITELPSPKDLRIDQLLTSRFFGLNTVIDPETERKFDRYYELQAMGEMMTDEQRIEFENLEPEILERKTMLGSSLMEELEYKVIKEKFEHFSSDEGRLNTQAVEDDIKKTLKEKWNKSLYE